MIKCPQEDLETLLNLVNPIIFNQVFYEQPPNYRILRDSIPHLTQESLAYLFQEEARDYAKGNLDFLIFLNYFRDDISGIELDEEVRLIARTSLKKHVNECSSYRNFYLEDFLKRQIEFYSGILGYHEIDEDIIKDIDEKYLGLII